MSVSSTNQQYYFDPVKGQDLITRFSSQGSVTGDASGGVASISLNIQAGMFEKPYWILTDIHPFADNSGAGDVAISIQTCDPIHGPPAFIKHWYADLAGAAMGPAGAQMLPRLENYPRRFSTFPYRYNAGPLNTFPAVMASWTNGLFTFHLLLEGYLLDEKVIPKLIPVFSLL